MIAFGHASFLLAKLLFELAHAVGRAVGNRVELHVDQQFRQPAVKTFELLGSLRLFFTALFEPLTKFFVTAVMGREPLEVLRQNILG